MSRKHETPLLLNLKPSKLINWMFAVMFMFALGACLINSLPVIFKIFLLTVICTYLWRVIDCLKSKLHTIKHTEALGWEISINNDVQSVQILPSTVITIVAVFLHVKYQNRNRFRNGKQTILVLNDALCEDDYRRLIVRLKTSFAKQKQLLASTDKV
ncbi:MAG: protein YgfX [Methylococcaceae bacterium]